MVMSINMFTKYLGEEIMMIFGKSIRNCLIVLHESKLRQQSDYIGHIIPYMANH